jgi:cob(I)alamin adenosyltransferase
MLIFGSAVCLTRIEGREEVMKGNIHVFTGDGKGKTTAALGMAMKAAGVGQKVFIAQFIKSDDYSEIKALERFSQFIKSDDYSEIKALERFSDLISVEQYGLGCFIEEKATPGDIEATRQGLEKVKRIISSGEHRVVILDWMRRTSPFIFRFSRSRNFWI